MAKKAEVQHSEHFAEVKGYFDDGFWNKSRVRAAIGKWITPEEYEEITGESYGE